MIGVHATAIGQGRQAAIDVMVEAIHPDNDLNKVSEILFEALGAATDGKFSPGMVEMKLL
jgi:20S proteasome alpha/beta subunit